MSITAGRPFRRGRTREQGRRFARAAIALLLSFWAPFLAAQTWRTDALAAFDEVWKTIHETYHDPAFGGVDWDGARAELRPAVDRAASPDAARDVIRTLLSRLGRSHFALLTTAAAEDGTRGEAAVPVETRLLEGELIVTELHDPDGPVRRGDRIVSVDGQPVRAPGAPPVDRDDVASLTAAWREATRPLYGAAGSIARLVVADVQGRERAVAIRRMAAGGEVVRLGHLPPLYVRFDAYERRTARGARAGVIRFNVWMPAVAEPFAEAVDRFRSADGIVIDLRGNPGGLADMMRGIAGHLLDEPALLGRMQMRNVALEFRANPRRSTTDGRRVTPFAGAVAILVDELTASASECFAGGLQSLGRARVFGTRSAGQALPASTRPLSNGDVLLYAIGDFVTSTGRRLEGSGVVPDEVVSRSAGELAAGRDGPLDAALAWIDRVRPPAPRAAR